METTTLSFIVLFLLIFLSAFFSAAETAITSINRLRLKHLVEEKARGAKTLEGLLEHPGRLLATILFGNNLVNIAAAALATSLAIKFFGNVGVGISTGIMTFLVLIFGEITPKTFAAQNAERLALGVAGIISFLCVVLYPVIRIFVLIANLFIRLIGGKTMKEGPFVTEEEIRTLVTVGEEEGVIEEEEKEMIHSIFDFTDTVVKEVMVPRMDMICVENTTALKDVLDIIAATGHSRVPVYEKTIDNIVGVVYAKDILIEMAKEETPIALAKLIRQPYYVPETKRVSELLKELQNQRMHMAIVLDEYGGTAGLVTIEDLLEEIVGEILDEYDLEEVLVEPIDERTIRVNARMDLGELEEVLGVDLPDLDFETVAGMVFKLFGRIPSEGEKVDFDNLTFTVEKVSRRRISKVLITKKLKPKEEQVDAETE